MERFGGIARLYGDAGLDKFSHSHVCVVGIGGVGSWIVESLARSGIGAITMVDLDEICVSNINRQLHAMDGEIGRQKTTAMAQRIKSINPSCRVECIESFFTARNADSILDHGFDYVIDAIDRVKEKSLLLAGCHQRNTPVFCCGGAGGLRDPSQIICDDLSRAYNDALLNQTRRQLRAQYGFPAGAEKKRKARKFGISCVFSAEPPVFPTCDGRVSLQKTKDENGENPRLNCVSGFGSITHITATFGMFAVAKCLDQLSAN